METSNGGTELESGGRESLDDGSGSTQMYSKQLDLGKVAAKGDFEMEGEEESIQSFREINSVHDSLDTNFRIRDPNAPTHRDMHRRGRRSDQQSPPTCELVDVTLAL